LRIHFFYSATKTILDIHGIVPEENLYANNRVRHFIYSVVERKAIRSCSVLIHVTNAMRQHFASKYKIDLDERSIVLPIFDSADIGKAKDIPNRPWNVVYAGGMQAWQNIDLMVSAVLEIMIGKRSDDFHFYFFFPEVQVRLFIDKYPELLARKNVKVSSLGKPEMRGFMSRCQFGFLLRDDILINRVACPTKLVEYLECGVVPIVVFDEIGDFKDLGYDAIALNDFMMSDISDTCIRKKIDTNYMVMERFCDIVSVAQAKVKKLILAAR
jgi:hypothetical protein